VHLALAGVVVAGVCVRVYLIEAYVLGAGSGALDALVVLGPAGVLGRRDVARLRGPTPAPG
jgi:hypothetical protein